MEYFKVSDDALQLECPVFAPNGNLLFCAVSGGQIFRLAAGQVAVDCPAGERAAVRGVEVHWNERIFMVELGDFKSRGSVVSMAANGKDIIEIVSRDAGFLPDDLVFDRNGEFDVITWSFLAEDDRCHYLKMR